MQKDVFEKTLKRKVSQITFSGHRVNDDYSLNKRKVIMAVVLSAFDEAAEHSVHPTSSCCRAEIIPGIRQGEPSLCANCGGTCG